MYLLRRPILALSDNRSVRNTLTKMPVTGAVVDRFIAGDDTVGAVDASRRLHEAGMSITLDFLGENTTTTDQADATVLAYLTVLDALVDANEAAGSEVSVKLSAVGQSIDRVGEEYSLASALRIADAAYSVGARVTLDMEDHTTIDATLAMLAEIRRTHPDVGVAIQAMLHRTPADLEKLAGPGSRVRLVKGAYDEPADVAWQKPEDVDLAYVRGLKILMAGEGYPMVGSHDPRMIAIAGDLAARQGRSAQDYEHQFLYGIRPEEQRRLVADGKRVRVYVPYGSDWYGYFTRRLAERPANLLFFLRAIASRD